MKPAQIKTSGVPLIYLLLILLYLSTGCAHSESISPSKAEDSIDLNRFFGDKIDLPGKHSDKIRNINLSIVLPPDHKILPDARPYFQLLSKDGKNVGTFPLHGLSENFAVHKKFLSDTAYIDLALYYCREGDQGLCLIKNVLFKVSLDNNLPQEDLQIIHVIAETKN